MAKIDITSTAVEKGLDTAKDFVNKLIGPAVEEAGLLIKDQVSMWRFKNQINMLTKAKSYCDKKGVPIKKVSLKLLCPLLENASLEEDEVLQDKWAILLSNLVDSTQNIENHVFPYLLGQISRNEFAVIEEAFKRKRQRVQELQEQLHEHKTKLPQGESELKEQLQNNEEILKKLDHNPSAKLQDRWETSKHISKLRSELYKLQGKELQLKVEMRTPEAIAEDMLKGYEISNLIRLGLIRELHETNVDTQTLDIPPTRDESVRVKFDLNISTDRYIILTDLGEVFANACTLTT